jgi:cytosine deaminase
MDIGIDQGKIVEIAGKVQAAAALELDAGGGLVTESYANPHLHLCKVYTLNMLDEAALKDYHGADMGKAMSAIELAARVKEQYDERWIIENVRRAMKDAARYGCTHIREGTDVRAAVTGRVQQGAPHILDNPTFIIFFLHPRRQLDRRHGLAHIAPLVILKGGLIHHR